MRNHKLCYMSSYDRGLEWLLMIWPRILEKFPDATLDICYGWVTFKALNANNPERQEWKVHMISGMKQKGIKEHGRIGKKELQELRQSCGILAYPSNFFEIFCINAVEAQMDGVVPVTTDVGALPETVQCGVVVKGDIRDEKVQETYLKELLALMGDEKRWKDLSDKGMEFAKQYDWKTIARKWTNEMSLQDLSVKLTVYTPTIRTGWWNIMADNLSKQTYTNFEWIIVDDYPEDRSEIAKAYAKEYNLDITYLRGKDRKKVRTYGLCNANNTALAHASGEVLVFLQDFILIPLDGLEQIATLYRRNPTALQSLPDMYFTMKHKPDLTKEDWFNGKLDVIGAFQQQNVRIQNLGLRKTINCMDFEQNYGAIPVSVAKELGGWWEFFDEALGYDNTEIAYRALLKGYEIIIDETNVAICLDLWPHIGGQKQNGGSDRGRRLNDPRFYWMTKGIKENTFPLIRTQEKDDTVDLQYTIPKEVEDKDVEKWMEKNIVKIIEGWV